MRATPSTKPILIGIYQIGWGKIEVWADPTTNGGSVSGDTTKRHLYKMIVGFKPRDIRDAWGTLMHEAMEYIMSNQAVRYKKTDMYENDCSDSYHFIFNHNQFTEICAQLGWFSWSVSDAFVKAWRKTL